MREPGRSVNWWPVLMPLCALAVLSSVWLLRPYAYMRENHALQLPRVQHDQSPALYPHDPFVATLDTYASLYWTAVARFTALPTATTLGIVYLLTVVGGLAAAWLLGRALAPGSTIAPWAAAIALGLGAHPLVGGGTIVIDYPEQTSLSVVFFTLAFAAIAARKPWLAAVAYATGFMLNQMYGVHVGLYVAIFAMMVVRGRLLDRRWLGAALLAAVAIMPVIQQSRATAAAMSLPDRSFAMAWAGALHHAGGAHFYLADNPGHAFGPAALALLVVLAVAHADRDAWRRALAMSAAAAAAVWFGVAALLAYGFPPSRALELHAVRGGDLFWVFALIYPISQFSARYEHGRPGSDGRLLHLTGIVGLLGLFGLVPRAFPAVALLGLVAFDGCRNYLRRGNAGVMVCAMVLVMLVVAIGTARTWHPVLFRMGPSRDLQEAAAWASAHTAIGATFMVSPEWDPEETAMFRPLARRGLFVAQKDISAIHWDAAYLPTFLERMAALGAVEDARTGRLRPAAEIRDRWRALTDRELTEIACRYRVDFAVLEAERPTRLPVLFANRSYQIVRLAPPVSE